MRDAILRLIAEDVNQDSRRDVGREGFDDWQILVLAAVRLGCDLDYDKMQDLSSGKSPMTKERMKTQYRKLLKRSLKILRRAEELVNQVSDQEADVATLCKIMALNGFIELTKTVYSTAHRRVIEGETVPNSDKIFSIFETHTHRKRAPSEFQKQTQNASIRFRDARQRHPGIESAIGALQSGNALERCRDRTENWI